MTNIYTKFEIKYPYVTFSPAFYTKYSNSFVTADMAQSPYLSGALRSLLDRRGTNDSDPEFDDRIVVDE